MRFSSVQNDRTSFLHRDTGASEDEQAVWVKQPGDLPEVSFLSISEKQDSSALSVSSGSVGIASAGILKLPCLEALLGAPIVPLSRWPVVTSLGAVAVWGRRPSAVQMRAFAVRKGVPIVSLEDGFLRSFGTGKHFPPLSLVLDTEGIYYDSTRPSSIESLLNAPTDVQGSASGGVERAKALILKNRLSKYNHSPILDPRILLDGDSSRVLVVDQTAGDMSVALGNADASTFHAMLLAALAENSTATVYVKTHPEVRSGRKSGYLTSVRDGARTVVLRDPINPLSLIEQMDRVYVVSSTMGFEALLSGKPVTCFGIPWYAGWGVTDDRQACPRRVRRRTVDELFAAAYFHYARYLNPVTRQLGTIFDVIDWLIRQRQMAFQRFARWDISPGPERYFNK